MPFASNHASTSKQLVLGIAHISGRAKVISHKGIFAARYIRVARQLDCFQSASVHPRVESPLLPLVLGLAVVSLQPKLEIGGWRIIWLVHQ
ncbi:hypothetical protein BM221_010006 [Beauveria bassiana]|uniref:Uncharacterized protein n=1 Tax=Beauveria bassiana TaxID=176275 RepID=A0A2N6NAB3_BEABA|nr:hypothetical protein BM221_010006 [Beauveria bassiana]